MQIVDDDLWFCVDCMLAEVNGDMPEDDETAEQVEEGLDRLTQDGCYLTINFDSNTDEGIHEFSWNTCDCCGSHLGGSRYRFALMKG